MSRQETALQPAQPVIETVKDRDLRKLERDGYVVMASVMGFGEASRRGRLAKAVHVAQLIVIAFAFMTPVFLFWKVAL